MSTGAASCAACSCEKPVVGLCGRNGESMTSFSRPMTQWPKVVIVGAGFGGLAAARILKHEPLEVTLIDRNNFHSFQPLLYQVATAALSPADVAWPIRNILRGQANVTVLMTEVSGVDTATREVIAG